MTSRTAAEVTPSGAPSMAKSIAPTIATPIAPPTARETEIVAVAAPSDGVADDFFRAAARIHLSRIDHGHAEIEANLQRLHLVGPAPGAVAHLPGAEAELRDCVAFGKLDGWNPGHGALLTMRSEASRFNAFRSSLLVEESGSFSRNQTKRGCWYAGACAS